MKAWKKRIDELLVEKGLVESREKARRLIMAGYVRVNGDVVDKPGRRVDENVQIELAHIEKYVSRGAYKLLGALEDLGMNVEGLVACDIGASTGGFTQVLLEKGCDIGASTGGFTQVLLEKGARKVYAVDVGRGQLHWKLRNDERVVVMEKTNARYLEDKDFEDKIDVVTIDVSFISLKPILKAVNKFLKDGGYVLALVKPQFELGKGKVKKGVVRKLEDHISCLYSVVEYARSIGFSCRGMTYSRLKGPKGNIEFFLLLIKDGKGEMNSDVSINEVVVRAHKELGGAQGGE